MIIAVLSLKYLYMRKSADITDSEWVIMRVLWDRGSATASEITASVKRERDVSPQTIKTLIRRLVDKHIVGYAIDPDDSRVYHYRPLIRKEDAVRRKSETFAAQVYQNNVGDLVAHFVENSGLTEEELLQLQRVVKKKLTGKK